MRSATSIVSVSRISPIRTTSGSSRSAARNALPKPGESVWTSRWLTMEFLCRCTNSIGSSIVRMCPFRSVLIVSTIVASVVLFPAPAGPVINTSPLVWLVRLRTMGGSPRSSNDGICSGISR